MQNIKKWKPSKFVYKKGKLVASRNKQEVSLSSRLMADLIAKFYDQVLPTYAKGNLLDLGCGKVPLYGAYKDKISNCICVDWDNSLHKNEFIDKSVDLNESLPFEDKTFDTVILSDVLEHIRNPLSLWHEMNRVLKENGILILNVPFHYWIHEHPFDYYRYTKYALENFATESNFEIIALNELGGIIEVLTDFIAKSTIGIPLIGKCIASFIQWKSGIILKLPIGKIIMKKTSRNFTLAYGLVAKKSSV